VSALFRPPRDRLLGFRSTQTTTLPTFLHQVDNRRLRWREMNTTIRRGDGQVTSFRILHAVTLVTKGGIAGLRHHDAYLAPTFVSRDETKSRHAEYADSTSWTHPVKTWDFATYHQASNTCREVTTLSPVFTRSSHDQFGLSVLK
jgi:hypothetical protein